MKAKASLWRVKDIFLIALRHVLLHVLHQHVARWPKLARRLPGSRLPAPDRLRVAIEEIGGTFIKFGQMMAMQTDLLPLDYCAALYSLFDQVPAFDYSEVEKTFLKDLQRGPLEVFDSFDTRPVATGSIGQVHRATLQGQKVAVKVMRPTIISEFNTDIATLRFTVRLVKLVRWRSLYWIIAPTEEFVAWTQEELDYRREAHYMDELGRNARNNPNEKVPAVFWSCTTARILTAEFLEGVTISELLRVRAAGNVTATVDFDQNLFAGRLVDNFLGDAFRHGMFHADLHPGNLMIMRDNVVGYIDFGISGVLSRYSRRHLISMTLAYARGDLEAMCESFFRITTFDKNADLAGFHQGLKDASADWYGNGMGESRLRRSITSIMLDLLVLSRQNGIWPQRDVIKYIRSAIALDGLVKTFSPEMDIGLHLEQACERHIKWDSSQNLISSETLVGWFGGSANLVRDGVLRAIATLRHLGTDDSPEHSISSARPRNRKNNRSARAFSFTWVAICAAMIFWPSESAWSGHSLRIAGPALLGLTFIIWQALKSVRAT